jgi:hypothetical protein
MRHAAWIGLVFLAGCSGLSLSEADDGKTVKTSAGSTVTLSLASDPSTQADPKIAGGVLQFKERRKEADREILVFSAVGPGESEIRFPNFVVRVIVTSEGHNPVIVK